LRNADFFEVAKFPHIIFQTTKSTAKKLTGELTMKGVTKTVELDVEVSGPIDSPFEKGVKIIGLHASGKVNRQDFGVAPDGASDKLIGDTVSIDINLEGKK
ncbi:MAG: YceI family protein, partial [Verrucomicrobiota bacterium]